MGEVTRIDKEKKVVELANGDLIFYDYLIVATGARHHYFGHPEWEQHAPGIKTLRDTLRIRENILLSFEKAERCADAPITERYLSFVVIGGGPTGCELAGAIAEIAHRTMLRDFRRIDPSRTRVYLLEAASQILPTFGEELGRKAQHQLEKLRVNVLVNSKVTDVTGHGVQLEGRFIEAGTVLFEDAGRAIGSSRKGSRGAGSFDCGPSQSLCHRRRRAFRREGWQRTPRPRHPSPFNRPST